MSSSSYITIILAGGRGVQLDLLTNETPKSAIIFGGVHRLIDFTLSNCIHSNVGDIGVVTQYCGCGLTDYIGCGSKWFPENGSVRVTMIPPKAGNSISELQTGTADALIENIGFIEKSKPKNILVLSGDQVYKMNYARMMKVHEQSGAVATIAAVSVPLAEASRHNIMISDKNNTIIDYKERPASPKSYLASMGVFVFDWVTLKKHLLEAVSVYKTGLEISRDIIPAMLTSGERIIAHRHHGYWKDIDNIYSLWEANMDLLTDSPGVDFQDGDWRIIGRSDVRLVRHETSHLDDAYISDSLVAEGCVIKGTVSKSVISTDVEVGKDARIIDSVIMPGARIGKGAVVLKAIVGAGATVDDYTAVGGVKPDGRYLDNIRGVSAVGSNASVFTSREGRLKTAATSMPESRAV